MVGALPQVHRGEVEAEHLHRADQRREARADQRVGMMRLQRRFDDAQVGQELGRRAIGVLRRHRVAQGLGAGQLVQRGGQPRIDADQRAPIGLVLAVRVVVGRGFGQRAHLRRHGCQRGRDRQLGAQLVRFGQVEAQHRFALPRQRHAQGLGGDEGVAVAVATDPVAHAEEAGDRVARQRAFELAVHARDLAQEGRVVVRQRVLDLVADAELGGAQHARLPELGDAGANHRLVIGAVALGGQGLALFHQLGDGALGIEDALALHFGRVGREHRRDVGMGQRLGDVATADAGLGQALERHRERAFLQMALPLVVIAAAHVVPVLGDVGQVREVAERADHAHRLVAAQVLQ